MTVFLKTSFEDKHNPEVETEERKFEVHSTTVEHPSSVVWWIPCPFCTNMVKAYLWSLAGGGKRCPDCGAIFSSWGTATRRVEE